FETDKGAVATSDAIQVSYLSPPRDAGFENKAALEGKASEKALVDLSALVQSVSPVKKESVRVRVNTREFVTDGVTVENVKDTSWRIPLKNVPRDEGVNDIRLWAGNDDGECRAPGALKLEFKPAKAASPPVVEIVNPAKDSVVTVG